MIGLGLFLIAAGLFSAIGAALDWEWFMTHRKAWLFVKLLGRGGARVFYVLFGLGLATFGALTALGVIHPGPG